MNSLPQPLTPTVESSIKPNRRILIWLGLLVGVVVIFLWQVYPFKGAYFDWLKSIFVQQELLLSEEQGFDLSEINFEGLLGQEKAIEEEVVGEQVKEFVPEVTLAGIQEKVNEIGEKVEEINREVNKLIILTEIQKEINDIAREVARISQEVKKLS